MLLISSNRQYNVPLLLESLHVTHAQVSYTVFWHCCHLSFTVECSGANVALQHVVCATAGVNSYLFHFYVSFPCTMHAFAIYAVKDSRRSEMGNRMSLIVRPIAKILPSSHTPSSPSTPATTSTITTSTRTRSKLARAKTVCFRKPKDQNGSEIDMLSLSRARIGSMFYSGRSSGFDVTTPLTKDKDFAPLNMGEQNTVELIGTMKCELTSLSDMILPISTGKAAINLTVREKKHTHDGTVDREFSYLANFIYLSQPMKIEHMNYFLFLIW